jgi:hypothetical protein
MRVRSLGVRWNVARKAVSELGGLYPTKKTGFRRLHSAALGRTLRIYVGDCPRSTSISGSEQGKPNSGVNFAGNFLSPLRILTSRISMACSDQCWRPSRGALITSWST